MSDPLTTTIAEVCSSGECAPVDPAVALVIMVLSKLAEEANKDEPFGPNNELRKALTNIGADLKKGPGPNNDIVKAINNIVSDLRNGPTRSNDILRALRVLFPNV
jgi:hypothetical protein